MWGGLKGRSCLARVTPSKRGRDSRIVRVSGGQLGDVKRDLRAAKMVEELESVRTDLGEWDLM